MSQLLKEADLLGVSTEEIPPIGAHALAATIQWRTFLKDMSPRNKAMLIPLTLRMSVDDEMSSVVQEFGTLDVQVAGR